MLIDSHCHLDFFEPQEVTALIARAEAAGVTRMVTIGTRFTEREKQIALAETHPQIWATIGVHPHNAGEHPVLSPEAIAGAATHPRIIGIGESGLDYFYETAPIDAQKASFRAHIAAARLANIPLVIHARQADDDIAGILEHATGTAGPFAFLLHCFSSGRSLAERALALGGYISFSGMITFPKSTEIRDIAAGIPPDRLLVETDAPYLAPVPFRGKRNEPSYVAHTAARLAEVRGLDPATLAELTSRNFHTLFRKAS